MKKLRCLLGLHKEISVTIGGYIRCFDCGKDRDFISNKWIDHNEFLSKFIQVDPDKDQKKTVIKPL